MQTIYFSENVEGQTKNWVTWSTILKFKKNPKHMVTATTTQATRVSGVPPAHARHWWPDARMAVPSGDPFDGLRRVLAQRRVGDSRHSIYIGTVSFKLLLPALLNWLKLVYEFFFSEQLYTRFLPRPHCKIWEKSTTVKLRAVDCLG